MSLSISPNDSTRSLACSYTCSGAGSSAVSSAAPLRAAEAGLERRPVPRLRQQAEADDGDGAAAPGRVQRREQGGGLGSPQRRFERCAQVSTLGGGEQDQIQRLHHDGCEPSIRLRLQQRGQAPEGALRPEQRAEAAHHQRAARLHQRRAVAELLQHALLRGAAARERGLRGLQPDPGRRAGAGRGRVDARAMSNRKGASS